LINRSWITPDIPDILNHLDSALKWLLIGFRYFRGICDV